MIARQEVSNKPGWLTAEHSLLYGFNTGMIDGDKISQIVILANAGIHAGMDAGSSPA
jgi:hypothetical protein